MTGPPARAWRPRPGRTRALVEAEQDKAAGGAHRRAVRVETGETARGHVLLKASGGVVRAYLRWRSNGRSVVRALGPVDGETRMANLAEGWERARAAGLVGDEVRPPGSWASSPAARATMRANRGRDTLPERRLRALLHRRGLRYRVSFRPLPDFRRTADIVFPGARVAVFVDGCYWHGCPDHYQESATNSAFWRDKIATNVRRDRETTRVLEEQGWTVVRCWEHEEPSVAAERVFHALDEANGRGKR
ncbi:very short patch repair endonuclease [Actinokineospora sp. UTMC 2448]|uniref:very short patch repair endonuclease n=1 Tax=Actinokineospora sp. UTMC 2448 TaxID=2268449 RepID=UPI00220F2DA9|nr:DNA mismatch endonuclease Vsr [Actinokineospora sp. UTMC 2448]UVS76835.1 Very short patch repair protein [Actinokineospora sp. UTMC 2448]